MTRLAYDLGGWTNVPFSGDEVLTAEQIAKEADTFASARLWDPRPLRTTLDQLQTVRKYYDFTDVDTDRYMINGVAAPGDALGPRAGPRAEPERHRLGQPADPSTPTASAPRWSRSTRSPTRASRGS